MLKTLRLRNLIMAGQITGGELEELLQRKDYEGAFCDLRNDERWMDDMTQSPVALEAICGSPAAVVLLCKNTMSASKFGTIRDFTDVALLDSNALDPLLTITGVPTVFYNSLELRTALFNSSAGRGAVWSSSHALSELENHSAALAWLASSGKRKTLSSIRCNDTAIKVANRSITLQVIGGNNNSHTLTFGTLGGGSGSGNNVLTLPNSTTAVLNVRAYTDLRLVGSSMGSDGGYYYMTLHYVDMN